MEAMKQQQAMAVQVMPRAMDRTIRQRRERDRPASKIPLARAAGLIPPMHFDWCRAPAGRAGHGSLVQVAGGSQVAQDRLRDDPQRRCGEWPSVQSGG